MSRNSLQKVADANKKLVENQNINIPRTLNIRYGQFGIRKSPINGQTCVKFEKMKTDDCALHYLQTGQSENVVVMNFASRHHHGGGYTNGARAQEEDLCRVMPQLYPSLCKIKYPYEPDSILITPNVKIMRDNVNYNLFPERHVYEVGVVSAAAQNLKYEQFNRDQIVRTLENVYTSVKAVLPETDTLILGAWGCGAYGNDPDVMAKIMNDINLAYGGLYKTIVFSIPEGINVREFQQNIQLF